jgi:hypothetical protein
MAYTMERSGDFYAIPRGDLHCGDIERDKPHRFTYEVRCAGSKLDSSGFLINQLDVNKSFQDIGEFSESCEQLAERMAYLIMGSSRELSSVSVSVSPVPNAKATYEVKRKLSARKLAHDTARVSHVYADDWFDDENVSRVNRVSVSKRVKGASHVSH